MKKDNLNNSQGVPFQTSLDCVTFTISIFWPDCDVDARFMDFQSMVPILTGMPTPNHVIIERCIICLTPQSGSNEGYEKKK